MNKIIVSGRLTRDPELRRTNDGKAVVSCGIAVDRRFSKDKVDFFDIVAWTKTAEFMEQYLTKGRKVVVSGTLQTRDWLDKEGHTRRAYEIIAEEVEFADSNPSGNAAPSNRNFAPAANQNFTPADNQNFTPAQMGFQVEVSDEELPF